MALPTPPALPGARVIPRDSIESDLDDRLRHPIDPEEEGVAKTEYSFGLCLPVL